MKGEFMLPIHTGLANAIRRTLLDDLKRWAPDHIDVGKNTTCQTDEFIAHRIGLVPFRRIGNGNTMTIHVKGRNMMASDMMGPAFEPVHDMTIMDMIEDQEFEAAVTFSEHVGSKHARYKMCSGVGIKELNNNMYRLTFETLDDRDPNEILREVIEVLNDRVDNALQQLGHVCQY